MKQNIVLILVCLSIPAWSAAQNDWQCVAHDGLNQQWQGQSDYQRAAINIAFDACKKSSEDPGSCHVANADCEYFLNGQTTRPMWRCIALDQMAREWPSNVYPQRDDAAIAARAYCQDKSGFPDTCYTNLMTCKNLNERN